MDKLWKNLNNKWALFNQREGGIQRAVGHVFGSQRSGAYELYLTESIIAYQSIK